MSDEKHLENEGITKYEPLWGSWYIESLIGHGSFGKVYKAYRQDYGRSNYSAVKIISIPQDESEINLMAREGMDEASMRKFFLDLAKEIVSEIDLICQFRGNSHIVSIEDYQIIEKSVPPTSQLGWDILIRMELLNSLSDYVTNNPLSENEVVKLGVHMCRALELCAQKNIIHRDIKPDNIFISPYGDFKLGDFGIARQIEKTTSEMSRKGTNSYMAPEIFKDESYGANVDIYSLGLVMYNLLNRNRSPFLPAYPQPILPGDRDFALKSRISGVPIPNLTEITPELNRLVLKACAYNRLERFENPTQMREALEHLNVDSLGSRLMDHYPLETGLSGVKDSRAPARQEQPSKQVIMVGRDTADRETAKPAVITEQAEATTEPVNQQGQLGRSKRTVPIPLWIGMAAFMALSIVLAVVLALQSSEHSADLNSDYLSYLETSFGSNGDEEITPESDTDSETDDPESGTGSEPGSEPGSQPGSDSGSGTPPNQNPQQPEQDKPKITGVSDDLTFRSQGITSDKLAAMVKNGDIPQNVRILSLIRNQITDISSLRTLTKTFSLCVSHNQVTDVAPLQSLTELRFLDLGYNGTTIADFSPLGSITTLEELTIAGNTINNYAFLKSLKKLYLLNLNESHTSDLTVVSSLTGLKVLKLNANRITDLSPLKNLTGLQTLELDWNDITDLTPLKSLTNLRTLSIAKNPKLTGEQIADLQKALPKCTINVTL